MKQLGTIILLWVTLTISATTIRIPNAQTWTRSELSAYQGQTITFAEDWYVCNNYRGSYTISPRRIFSPTNMALPLSQEYSTLLTLNNLGTVTLTNVSGSHRCGERLHNLTVYVASNASVRLVSCDWVGNTRADLTQGFNIHDVDARGTHNVLVCAMNLQWYLVENLGTGYGPDNETQHSNQRTKVSSALAKINADIYGVMEVERGQAALAELAQDLTTNTGRHFTYINDGTSTYSSYTKSGYVYCSDVVEPDGAYRLNNTKVSYRKYMQAFRHKESGETFIFSINHFKAKSGTATGADADQGDGQGIFNATRTAEAYSVLNAYDDNRVFYQDSDILIMGDLNAYAKEDPVRVLTNGGMIDLHRYFHADSSYSYNFRGETGYLDHALCNTTMLSQVTGMTAYHINSDDFYDCAYTSSDRTMFRCSDHDPIIVGLQLGQRAAVNPVLCNTAKVLFHNGYLSICNATGGYVRIYDIRGLEVWQERITGPQQEISCSNWPGGTYIIHLYCTDVQGVSSVQPYKMIIL